MIFDFTHSYPRKKQEDLIWNDCSEIEGSRLYCDKEAEEKIRSMIEPYGVSGIHFIDSGDYHYVTKIMTDFIAEPFSLVLIDHHTDMQKSVLLDMLSCGNWARKVLETNPFLNVLVLVGQEEKSLKDCNLFNRNKIITISYQDIKNGVSPQKIHKLDREIPVYISVDKDVLDDRYAVTNWDQGEMSLYTLENILKYLVLEYEVIGIDICGDDPERNEFPEFLNARRINAKSDDKLYGYLQKLFAIKKR
ncbi:MAG: arginase family protein [Eubacterium sp.]|nr:arginase family protein [Eubacterium sp.]MDD7209065.1 arginase family protein [Lachnospiraceae bacterium]MDY5496421.1 arginase family protein [Anaerobutyricum sp.]